jgi:hypothetical protein
LLSAEPDWQSVVDDSTPTSAFVTEIFFSNGILSDDDGHFYGDGRNLNLNSNSDCHLLIH